MSGEIVALSTATDDYVRKVGVSTGGENFTAFNFAPENVMKVKK